MFLHYPYTRSATKRIRSDNSPSSRIKSKEFVNQHLCSPSSKSEMLEEFEKSRVSFNNGCKRAHSCHGGDASTHVLGGSCRRAFRCRMARGL